GPVTAAVAIAATCTAQWAISTGGIAGESGCAAGAREPRGPGGGRDPSRRSRGRGQPGSGATGGGIGRYDRRGEGGAAVRRPGAVAVAARPACERAYCRAETAQVVAEPGGVGALLLRDYDSACPPWPCSTETGAQTYRPPGRRGLA